MIQVYPLYTQLHVGNCLGGWVRRDLRNQKSYPRYRVVCPTKRNASCNSRVRVMSILTCLQKPESQKLEKRTSKAFRIPLQRVSEGLLRLINRCIPAVLLILLGLLVLKLPAGVLGSPPNRPASASSNWRVSSPCTRDCIHVL